MADSKPKAAKVSPPPAAPVKEKDKPTGKPRGRPPELQKQLEEFFVGTGLVVSATINPFDGEVIANNAEALAESWHKIAQQNAFIKRILSSFLETSSWSAAIMATAAVAVPIMQNHRLIPAGIPHPFAKPPWLTPRMAQGGWLVDPQGEAVRQEYYEDPLMPGVKIPMTPTQNRTPGEGIASIRNGARKGSAEPPPGQHKYGTQ